MDAPANGHDNGLAELVGRMHISGWDASEVSAPALGETDTPTSLSDGMADHMPRACAVCASAVWASPDTWCLPLSKDDLREPVNHPRHLNGTVNAQSSETSEDDGPAEDDHSLFVANLPQRLSNHDLACALYALFHPFGQIAAVKASRDARGRPFGFVEYATGEAAAAAMARAGVLALDGRRVRLEHARRQRKVCVRARVPPGDDDAMAFSRRVAETAEDVRSAVQGHVAHDADCRLAVHPAADGGAIVAAVVKFDDAGRARRAATAWRETGKDWAVSWLSVDRTANALHGSSVRTSGLVQLVPGKDGSLQCSAHMPHHTPASDVLFGYGSLCALHTCPVHACAAIPNGMRALSPAVSSFHVPYDELYVEGTAAEDDRDAPDTWLFVGRLNSRAVTAESLRARLAAHGPLRYVRLYGRGAVGADGVPMDAYALVRYAEACAVDTAIACEHGAAWLGQTLKVEHARPELLTAMLADGRREPLFFYAPS